MANPLSWLAKAGKAILKGLGFAVEAAELAEPEIDIAVPAVAGIYDATVGFASAAEAALGAGTGAQKLAAVTTAATNYATSQGWTAAEADIQKWASAFADSLNLFPFKLVPPPTTTTNG
jgi:hypothetical protein